MASLGCESCQSRYCCSYRDRRRRDWRYSQTNAARERSMRQARFSVIPQKPCASRLETVNGSKEHHSSKVHPNGVHDYGEQSRHSSRFEL